MTSSPDFLAFRGCERRAVAVSLVATNGMYCLAEAKLKSIAGLHKVRCLMARGRLAQTP